MLTSIDAIRLKDRPVFHDAQFSGSLDKVYRAYRERSHYRGYQIRPVRTPHQHDLASKLVRRMYSGRGYSTESLGHRLDDPNRVTLAAWDADEVVATLTLGRDSSDGLHADTLYAREKDRQLAAVPPCKRPCGSPAPGTGQYFHPDRQSTGLIQQR